jgi:ribosomal protein S18 acetylase RimI-like enzyme
LERGRRKLITLDEMNSTEFQQYLNFAIKNYAEEHVKAGNWNEEESINKATKEYNKLLPEGQKTANNKLFTIRSENQAVGMIWLAQKSHDKGFIYDIYILEDYQGHGYGKQAMVAIEVIGRKLGLKKIGLHVFGHNKVARDLYEKIGYRETDILMEKEL